MSFYNMQPSISPNGEEIAFFSDRESWEAVFILNIKTEKVTRSVIQGGKGEKHESFHSFKSGIAWSPDSKRLAVTSKSKGKDVIHVIDAKRGGVKDEIAPDVQAILSPSWSRDGRYLAFQGMKEGYSDIYLWDLERKELKRLTQDIAHDDKPVFSPSGEWIAFESDRPGTEVPSSPDPLSGYASLLKYKDIYRIALDGTGLSRLTGGPYDEKMPTFGPSDSSLIFVSNRSGIDNMYLLDDSSGAARVRPISNLLTGCFTPSWSWDGKLLAFSLFEQGGWDIFVMKDPARKAMDKELPKTRFIKTLEDTTLSFFRPLNWSTLSSFNADSARADSAAKADSLRNLRKAARRDSLDKVEHARGLAIGQAIRKDSIELMERLRAEAEKERVARGLPPRPTDTSMSAAGAADTLPAPAGAAPADSGSRPAEPAPGDSSRIAAEAGETGRASGPPRDSALADATDEDGDKPGGRKRKEKPSPFLKDSSDYLDDGGNYIKRAYSPVWSLDNANAALGIDTYYGYGGLAYVTLSDLMGDQEVSFALNINGSWENTNGAVQYDYLAKQMDFSVMGYHQAYQTRSLRFVDSTYRDSVFLDRQWGFGGTVSYPMSVYTRVQLETRTLFSTRTHQLVQGGKLVTDDDYEGRTTNALFPTLRWVHDNSMWGMVGPVNGQRFQAGVTAVPPLLQDRFSYLLVDADLRKYWEFYKKYTLAVRLSAGFSEALGGLENPHNFYVGGEDFTFNAYANRGNIPKSQEEFYFAQFDFPLRGFDYYEFKGTRKFVANVEFRYPFIREFTVVWPIPLSLRYVMGNVFADYGGAWSRGDAFDEMGLGLGWGMRMNLGIFVLKYTRSWAIDGVGSHKNPQRDYWSLGAEF
jgi:Tol biopolymer transport system component